MDTLRTLKMFKYIQNKILQHIYKNSDIRYTL